MEIIKIKTISLLSETFEALGYRNFRLYFIGQSISNTGNWITNVAMILLVLNITHSGVAVGLLTAFQFGPVLLLTAWGGALADHVDKRKFLVLTQFLAMGQSIALAALAFTPGTPLWAIYALALLGGIFLAFDNPLRRSFVSEMVPEKSVANAVVLYSTILNLSRILGPSIAGILITLTSYAWCFVIDAISYIPVIVSLLMMRKKELYPAPIKGKIHGAVREGIRYIRRSPDLWTAFFMLGIIGILGYNFSVTLPLFVSMGLHEPEITYTILFTVMGIGSVVASLVIAKRKMITLMHSIWGAVALGLAMLALSLTSNISIAVGVTLLLGAATILYTTSNTTLVQLRAKPEMRGRVLGIQTVLLLGTAPIGGPILGWVADKWGGRAPLVLGGVATLVAAGLGYYIRYLKIRKLPEQEPALVREEIPELSILPNSTHDHHN